MLAATALESKKRYVVLKGVRTDKIAKFHHSTATGATFTFEVKNRAGELKDVIAFVKGERKEQKLHVPVVELRLPTERKQGSFFEQNGRPRDETVKRCLMLGEANFAGACAHAILEPGVALYATAFDSQEQCYDKYGAAETRVAALRAAGHFVAFGVDATALDATVLGTFDEIRFYFPHNGSRSASGMIELLSQFLACALALLKDGGVIKLAAMNTQWYQERFRIPTLVRTSDLVQFKGNAQPFSTLGLEAAGYRHIKTNCAADAGAAKNQDAEELLYTIERKPVLRTLAQWKAMTMVAIKATPQYKNLPSTIGKSRLAKDALCTKLVEYQTA